MREFDKYIKAIVSQERSDVPADVKDKIDQTLRALPPRKRTSNVVRAIPRIAATAACLIFITLFLLPNVSVAYANTLKDIPVIGDIVQVTNIRKYFYADEYHEMDIKVPEIQGENNAGVAAINKDIAELTDILLDEFYKDLEEIGDDGHSSLYVDYEMVTNTDIWFTLKICIVRAAGTGNTNYKFYHLNKLTGETVVLSDIIRDNAFYEIIRTDIKRQMQERMKKDSNLQYWPELVDDAVSENSEHNFYWNENGDMVIPFDKYDIAPGYMGTPEFTVSKDIIKDTLKAEWQ